MWRAEDAQRQAEAGTADLLSKTVEVELSKQQAEQSREIKALQVPCLASFFLKPQSASVSIVQLISFLFFEITQTMAASEQACCQAAARVTSTQGCCLILQARCDKTAADLSKKEAQLASMQSSHDALIQKYQFAADQVISTHSISLDSVYSTV